ncbi:DUF262 domain-containing protein, partial [Candidatus Poribacteria bacterium]|nr:DUF262 domain-containing protein [Candidatus Poribacteria bacterium]
GITPEELSDYYLNVRRNDELRYKQLLTQHDKNTLIQLLDGNNKEWFRIVEQDAAGTLVQLVVDEELPANAAPRLIENYRFFETELKNADLKVVYAGIQRLRIVDIVLDRPDDNPQLIFESLNSTGLELSEADLIRNYVLMGQKPSFQNRLYEIYWFPMEQRFGDQDAGRFDEFIRDYLTLKTRQIPNIRNVYDSFKRYVQEKTNSETSETIETIVVDISRYSKHYVCIALGKEKDAELLGCFSSINTLEVTVAYPFLLEVYEDYKRKLIEKSELIEILQLVESYVFRRAICDIPTNSLNRTFAGRLMPKVNKSNYLESLKEAFLSLVNQSDRYRYPVNSEFKQEFLVKGVYNNLRRCRYLLRKLENYERRHPHSCLDQSIEHVIPQNPDLCEEWQRELGENWREIREKYLHTIGNLTLIGWKDNPALSDLSFQEKQKAKGGFCESELHLNRSLCRAKQWNEKSVLTRAEELAEKAIKIWIYPE